MKPPANQKVNTDQIQLGALTYKPVTITEWDDLQLLFSEPGVQRGCWCMYWRLKRSDFDKGYGEAHRQAMKRIIESGDVPGILAYLDGAPIGWCSVAPREAFPVLDRSPTLKRVDNEPVWSIVCFFVSKSHRRRTLSKALIKAAIAYARQNGARIIEAYPLVPESIQHPGSERYMGLISTFRALGFEEVARRSKKRPIVRYYIPDQS